MSDRSSYQFCSRGVGSVEASQSIALEAQRMVREAAEPVPAGETVKGQLRRSARALGYAAGDWRIRAAWYAEAGAWSATAFEALKARYRGWKARRDRDMDVDRYRNDAAAKFLAIADRLRAQDETFHRADVDALLDLAGRLRRGADGGLS